MKYNHKEIEPKWQKKWSEDKVTKINKDDTKNKYYVLDMFPYPSGDGLHMGHTKSYTASDVFYRFKKMQGYNVLHPQGFDAFGLPAENFALKTGIHPAETTKKNIDTYIKQMKSLGLNYDFDEKIVTSDPKYYKWTQWIFEQFYKNDLVYQDTQKANWCSSCQTVIANEQVIGGECERCGTEIVQKEIPGWFFKITDFADDLIEDLDKVDWPEHTKKNQKNWIGKSEGATLVFKVKSQKSKVNEDIKVFTTRPDTLFGATYMVLAPEHKLVLELKDQITNWDEVEKYIIQTQNKTELDRMEAKEKTGVKLEGVSAINPANQEEIPVFIADYVLAGYGTGAIMAVPAHDPRDFEFANKYNLSLKQVIVSESLLRSILISETLNDDVAFKKILQNKKIDFTLATSSISKREHIRVNLKSENLKEFINLVQKNIKEKCWAEILGSENIIVFKNKIYKDFLNNSEKLFKELTELEPFVRSQKNFWNMLSKNTFFNELVCYKDFGTLVNSGNFTGMNSEEAKQKITEFVGGEMTTNYRLRDWSISRQRYWGCPIPIVYSPEGEAKLVPEEHLPWTLPTDVDFKPTGVSPLSESKELKERVEKIFGKGWTPEYDTMDTFVDSSWYFLRYPDVYNEKEFCSKERQKWLPPELYIGGAEHTYMHLLFARFFTKAMYKIGLIDFDEPFPKLRHQGMVLDREGKKMSKSKGNVVNPDEMIERFGADSVRTYMLFAAPLEDEVIWNEDNIVGVYRFLEKVWSVKDELKEKSSDDVVKELHKTIDRMTNDIEVLAYNTVVSDMMKFVNVVKKSEISKEDYQTFLKLLSIFTPYITQEIWGGLGNESLIQNEKWPEFNKNLAKDDVHTIVLQINGKVRSEMVIEEGTSEADVKKIALKNEVVKKWTAGDEPKMIIYIKNKLVNIVV